MDIKKCSIHPNLASNPWARDLFYTASCCSHEQATREGNRRQHPPPPKTKGEPMAQNSLPSWTTYATCHILVELGHSRAKNVSIWILKPTLFVVCPAPRILLKPSHQPALFLSHIPPSTSSRLSLLPYNPQAPCLLLPRPKSYFFHLISAYALSLSSLSETFTVTPSPPWTVELELWPNRRRAEPSIYTSTLNPVRSPESATHELAPDLTEVTRCCWSLLTVRRHLLLPRQTTVNPRLTLATVFLALLGGSMVRVARRGRSSWLLSLSCL